MPFDWWKQLQIQSSMKNLCQQILVYTINREHQNNRLKDGGTIEQAQMVSEY